jgi:hypothetical protein
VADSELARKLRVLPGKRLLVLNGPEGYDRALAPLPPGTETAAHASGVFDVVQVFVRNRDELRRALPGATAALAPAGILWVAWPKKRSKLATDLDRDSLWAERNTQGWVGVASIAVDATWSALRFKRGPS